MAVQEKPSSDLSYQMTGQESVDLRGEACQPSKGYEADRHSCNGSYNVVTRGMVLIRGGRTGICCKKESLRHVDVDSQGWRLSQENG